VHHHRDEVWTFVDGEGLLVLDGEVQKVGRGDVINIRKGVKHAVKALTDLRFIEVQSGDDLIEEDIDRYEFSWENS
jgi:mannose-1-phosphate guanylyltransferase